MATPRQLKIFTATFQNVGDVDEELTVSWLDNGVPPLGLVPSNGVAHFICAQDIFLESPSSITQVPNEHLIASLSMAAILGGEVLPGTQEYFDAVTQTITGGQSQARYLQTIVGSATLDAIRRVSDLTVGPEGTVYELDFKKVGASTVKTIRTDAVSISQYANRVNNPAVAVPVIAGAIYKQFPTYKKSNLGGVGSANRQAVIDFLANQYFWI